MSEPLHVLATCLRELQDVSGQIYDYAFPEIIVIGGQSAGKSSILEAIVGHSFLPRGTDIVTRCPIKVRLHQVYKKEKLKIVFGRDEFDPEKTFDDFVGVAEEIERRTVNRVGNTKNVSDKPIVLDIFSPDYPDLQFTDTPGFTMTTVRGQSGDICQQIEDLNVPIIKRENTVILAIQDANQDIGMSAALKIALRPDIDPEGKRTVGVLTKLDNLSSTTDKERVVQIIKNETKPLSI